MLLPLTTALATIIALLALQYDWYVLIAIHILFHFLNLQTTSLDSFIGFEQLNYLVGFLCFLVGDQRVVFRRL